MKKRADAYHHGDLRAALVHAALRLAKTHGADGVTLRGVARAAGVSEAAPYHHFRDRRDLLIAAAAEGFRALDAAVSSELAAAPKPRHRDQVKADDALARLARAYARFAVTQRGPMRMILGAHIADDDLVSVAELRAAAEPVRAALTRAVALALPRASAKARRRFEHMAWAQVHGVVSLVVEKEISPLPTADEAAALAADAVMLLAAGARARSA